MIQPIRMYSPDSNMYLIDGRILIDTSTGAYVEKIPIDSEIVINTHIHCDHIGGNRFVRGKIHIHREDVLLVRNNPSATYCDFFGIDVPLKVDFVLKGGETFETEERKLVIIHTPGHTPGSICVYDPENYILFSGDTLFAGTFGRTDVIGGNEKDLLKSLKKLNKLEIRILYPGHGRFFEGDVCEMISKLIENF